MLDPDKLWKVMKRRDMSPIDLIEKEDFEPRALGMWLTGAATPKTTNLKRLARVLGTSTESISYDDEE